MKINLNKSTKRALSLVLAFAMLIGSLFTANISVNIKTQAATSDGDVVEWDGTIAPGFSDTESAGTQDDPIEIRTPAELAYLVRGAAVSSSDIYSKEVAKSASDSTTTNINVGPQNATYGKYYKIADGIKAFDMKCMQGITIDSDAETVKNATLTGGNFNWNGRFTNSTYYLESDSTILTDYVQDSYAFRGTLDGNGVVIYNLYGSSNAMGLFPMVDCGATIKNLTVKASRFTAHGYNGGMGLGGIIGYSLSLGDATRRSLPVTVSGCSVTNCYIATGWNIESTTAKGVGSVGGIIGNIGNGKLSIVDCLITDNEFLTVSGHTSPITPAYGAFLGGAGQYKVSISVSTSVAVGMSPVSTNSYAADATFTDVFTDQTVLKDGITTKALADMQGEAAKTNMPNFAWGFSWETTDSYPQPIVVDTSYAWDGTVADEFADGTGTEDDPFIIENAEQLQKMILSLDTDGKYYKVADGVKAIYLNPVRGVEKDTFSKLALTGSALLKNWSQNQISESDYCKSVNGSLCDKLHRDAPAHWFAGNFDGNGVTIYGLYSKNKFTVGEHSGVGLFPSLSGNAIVKNFVVDTCYVESDANLWNNSYAGVLASSFGTYEGIYWANKEDGKYKLDLKTEAIGDYLDGTTRDDGTTRSKDEYETFNMCAAVESVARLNLPWTYDDTEEGLNYYGSHFANETGANVTVASVVVKNADVVTKGSNAYGSGFVCSQVESKGIKFVNCLYDGTDSTFTPNDVVTDNCAAFYTSAQGFNSNSGTLSCLAIDADYDIHNGTKWSDTAMFAQKSYITGSATTDCGASTATGLTVSDLPMLNWTAWEIVDSIPMPENTDTWYVCDDRYYKDAYKNSDWYSYENNLLPYGSSTASGNKGHEEGAFSDYDELMGAGTEADPYIIDNAQMLFEVIASGGMQLGVPQHFKLSCDIDLGGIQWVCYQTEKDTSPKVYYIYNAFGGIIDGDGHTITGMYTATTDKNAGFIPELASTGKVKNVHFRNSYAYASGGNYGIITGNAAEGSEIIGCSIEGSVNADYVGSSNGTLSNCYIVDTNGVATYKDGEPTANYYTGTSSESAIWYKGGENGIFRLVSLAEAMPYADVDGDGMGYEYDADDLSTLKQRLLKTEGYEYVYGDVSRNGVTNIRDMIILQREVIGDEVNALDGFWRNVKAGKFNIYYDETDNYDAARKLQLYLEETTGTDIAKTLGTTTANLTIRIVTDSTLGANNYSVSYDLETGVLSVSGGSFTAVEQGVLAFINGSNAVTGDVYTGSGSIDDYKAAIDVYVYQTSNDNGSLNNSSSTDNKGTYYYVWGDEFNESDDGSISYDKWQIRDKGGDATVGNSTSGDFANLKLANDAGLKLLNTVEVVDGGRLIMRRGVGALSPENAGYNTEASYTTDSNTGDRIAFDSGDMASNGLINSIDSLLFKHGYLEMQATLPNDKNAFPAWWLLSNAGNNNLDVSRSLYSKVYPENEFYSDLRPIYFSSEDATTYEYQLPTYTYEIDIFEIINNGSVKEKLYYNLHKWYSYSKSTQVPTESFAVYDLNWNEINANNSKFSTKLLSTTYNGSEHTVDSGAAIKYHANNIKTGQVNVAINEFGTSTASGKTYGKADGADLSWWEEIFGQTEQEYAINMITNIGTASSVTYKFGFLWTDKEMTYILKDTSGNLLSSVTIDLADLGYDNNSNILPDQYVYFLIDNHFYTNGSTVTTAGDMTIEYVRLYQLDGERDIVTPETEAFNSNTRW